MNSYFWSLPALLAQAPAEPAARSLAQSIHIYSFLPPLVLAISLVYSASRHEAWPRIFGQALRLCGAIVGIILVTTVILLLINTQV